MKKTIIAGVMALSLVSGLSAVTDFSAVTFPAVTAHASDKSEIAAHAGKYTLDVKLLQHQSDEESMGNGAFNQTAVLVIKEDGTAAIEVGLHSMPYTDKVGYLGSMKRVTKITKTNRFGYPLEFETEDVEVLEEYENVYDDFNKEGSQYADSNVTGKWYLETLAVYRQLCEHLIHKNIILFHGSVIAIDGIAYLFTAKSGTGKSTHTRLWREHFGNRAVMINDDKPLIKIENHSVTVYGTPWDGKHRISTNTSAPLKAICLLNRGTENHIHEITRPEAYPMLLQQTHRPMNPEKMQKVFSLLDRLCENVKLYRLECNMNPDAVTTAYQGMNMEENL